MNRNWALLLLALFSISSMFATDISGKWFGKMSGCTGISLPGHDSTPLYLTVRQKETVIEGEVGVLDDMRFSIRNPALLGNILTFDTLYGDFRLTVTPGKMIGEADCGVQKAKVILTGPVVMFPVILHRVQARYSDEARRAKYECTVVLWVRVDRVGRAADLKVVQACGLGLDEMAIEAVEKWRFRPATDHGKPVATETRVEVPFHLIR